ncbi:paraquat-inducible protein A [Aestuariirhabdus sp. Z084]|uniref:paraquat-inducible protein A n=1 Tax=Aestuariirhabdus haliotis TaxID=2918751 RepID=UPI00201B3CA9|nr:paraquat-inducible protein A [Aestuariirhabdus haliotis]MCL6415352.1 paraquat-inducible protein A [Aestuariirhabdus haliotis]MCL6419108.1 paraquat-inducible protein A [Aestuariirhabdus haliotis]
MNQANIIETHIACLSCDSLIDMSELAYGEKATCPVCGGFLSRRKVDGLSRVVAYALSSLILLAMSCAFPFLAFKSSGLENVTTLPGTVRGLYLYGMPELAFLVGAFIVVLPMLVMLLVLLLCVPLLVKQRVSWLPDIARIIFTVHSWCMVDVFIIGVIVSLVKIAAMATVVLGLSFFSYAAFSITFTLTLSNLDRLQLWTAVERLMEGQN